MSSFADLPLSERPREKALRDGMKSLTDTELMAIIFGTGIQGKPVTEMCREILNEHKGHLSRIARMNAKDFISLHRGIGPAKALTLLAGIELGLRAAADDIVAKEEAISSSDTAFRYMHPRLYALDHEEFHILLLRNNLTPITAIKVGQGGYTSTVVDVKVVMRNALVHAASAMMLFHNHPSGTLKPSAQDVQLTRKIKEAATLLDIRLLDHIIIGHNDFFSFHDNGLEL